MFALFLVISVVILQIVLAIILVGAMLVDMLRTSGDDEDTLKEKNL